MIFSKITITHTENVTVLLSFFVSFLDTRTNTVGTIQAVNLTTNPILPIEWGLYFASTAVYDTALFTITADSSNVFTVQSKVDYLVFTGYEGIFDVLDYFAPQPVNVGFTFEISQVTITAVPQPSGLPANQRTAIDTASKIKFVNSPLFIRENITNVTESIIVNLYIWDGALNKVISLPSRILNKSKVSLNDNYISVEISDYIKPFINPQFAYNRAAVAAITNQGVFIQAEIISVTNTGAQVSRFTPTFFCTLGYRWNYEQNIISDNGVQNYGGNGGIEPVEKWYNPKIHDYFFQDFDFTKTISNATTANVIKYNAVTPSLQSQRCTRDPSLIVFLNKLGLWEMFTPHGKFTASNEVKRTEINIGHRDPSQVDNTYTHSTITHSLDVKQSYVINTGSLTENMIGIIEGLVYSAKVYLIRFEGDLELVTTVGITIDNTFVTIDNTNITIDSQGISEEYVGFFKTHQQIPVIVTDSDFIRKTRINDKLAIDYNIKFSETNNKINNIR